MGRDMDHSNVEGLGWKKNLQTKFVLRILLEGYQRGAPMGIFQFGFTQNGRSFISVSNFAVLYVEK